MAPQTTFCQRKNLQSITFGALDHELFALAAWMTLLAHVLMEFNTDDFHALVFPVNGQG